MGAWGYGMRDNDSALDYIWGFQKHSIKYLLDEVKKWKKVKQYKQDAISDGADILGLAELFLDAEILSKINGDENLKLIKDLKKIIDHQLKALDGWRKPLARKNSLQAFRKRLTDIESF